MSAESEPKPGPYVPLEIYLKLSERDKEDVWKALYGMAKSYAKKRQIPLNKSQLAGIVEISVKSMQRMKSCKYLEGPNGIGTIIALASTKIPFAVADEVERFFKKKEDGELEPHESFNPELLAHLAQPSADSSNTKLWNWFTNAVADFHTFSANDLRDLIKIIDLIFRDDEALLFSFENKFTLDAGVIAKRLGISKNRVSKLAAHLRMLLQLQGENR